MDLKAFAVYQKLKTNSTLLEYIVKNKHIPIDVVEESMKELLDPLEHSESEALINDYLDHLKHTVKTNFSKTGDNVFDVSGHIADPVIESIELLHGVEREDVVRDVVGNVMGDLNSDREVQIDNVLLSAEADDFLRMATKPLFSAEHKQAVPEDIDHMIDEALNDSPETATGATVHKERNDVQPEAVDETAQTIDPADLEDIESFEAPMRDLHVASDYDEDDAAADIASEYDEDDAVDYDEEEAYDGDVAYDEEAYDEEIAYDESDNVVEDVDGEQEPADTQAHAMKQAYDFLIEQLHEKGLVDKLPGLHVPQAQ